MKLFIALVFTGLLSLGLAAPAMAQDPNAAPTYGEYTLRSGFPADPVILPAASGGNINVAGVVAGCQGFINYNPDVRIYYTAGTLPLAFSVNAAVDTTLVVSAPDGSVYCDDDGGLNGANPAVVFDDPQSGRYEIWIGTYSTTAVYAADLYISELYSQ